MEKPRVRHRNHVAPPAGRHWRILGDPMLDVYRNRRSVEAREAYMAKVEKEASDRNKSNARKQKKKEKQAAKSDL